MSKTVIEAAHISKRFGKKQVLEDISLKVERGQTVAIVGHNGCGKSTFLRILGNLTTFSGGRIDRLSGIKTAYIPERFPKSDFTARDYSVYMGMLDGLSKEEAREKFKPMRKWVCSRIRNKRKRQGYTTIEKEQGL